MLPHLAEDSARWRATAGTLARESVETDDGAASCAWPLRCRVERFEPVVVVDDAPRRARRHDGFDHALCGPIGAPWALMMREAHRTRCASLQSGAVTSDRGAIDQPRVPGPIPRLCEFRGRAGRRLCQWPAISLRTASTKAGSSCPTTELRAMMRPFSSSSAITTLWLNSPSARRR